MDAILLQYLITIWLCGQLVQQAAEVLKVWVAHLPRWENYVLLPGPQYSLLLMRSVFIAGASDETKPLVKSVRSSLPTVYPHLIKRHVWPVKTFNWQIRLKGNSKLFSGNSFGPLRDSNKGLGAAWQTLLAWIGLRLQRRLRAWCPVRFSILLIIPFVLRDRSFFMREGGLVGFGGGGATRKKLAWKGGGQPKKNEGKGGGGSDEKIRL